MMLSRYSDYRDAGLRWLGDVPGHWELSRLRFAATLNPSKSEIAGLDRGVEVSFLPMDAIGDDGTLKLEQTRAISGVESGYTFFRDGDVVIAKITPCFENGKGALMKGLAHGIGFGTTELIVVRPNPEKLNARFLGWLFRTPNFRSEGKGAMYGAGGQKRVPDDFIRDFAWALPPVSEQCAIADFLDRETAKIDALIAGQERLLELLAEKRQTTISHAVTKGLNPDAPMQDSGVAWLGKVPVHWRLPPLSVRYQSELGKMLDSARITGKSLVPYLRNTDVQWGRVNLDDLPLMDIEERDFARFTVRDGDLLVCEGGEVGRAAIVKVGAALVGFQKALHRLRAISPSENPAYLFYTFYWASRAGAFAGEGQSTIAHLTGEQLRRYRFPTPPLDEQIAIATHLDSVCSSIDEVSKSVCFAIELLKEKRSALIASAVAGQIDVRKIV